MPERLHADADLHARAAGWPETWHSVLRIIPKPDRMAEIDAIDAEYLSQNPDSGFLTEIRPLTEFPDYIDYLPHGSIVRKVGIMGVLPKSTVDPNTTVTITKAEIAAFVDDAAALVIERLRAHRLID